MSVYQQTPLSKLSNARRWLELFEADYPDPEDGPVPEDEQSTIADDTLLTFTKTYIADLTHATGLAVEYEDDFERYQQLKDAVHSVHIVFDHLGDLQGADEKLPSEMTALVKWLFSLVLDMVSTINALESENPQYPAIRLQVEKFYDEYLKELN